MGSADLDASSAGGTTTPRSRDDVLEAAGRLFARQGFHGTSMRDLGDELGLLGSSLYSHVRGKNELLVEVIGRGAELFNKVVAEATAAGGPAIEQLRALVFGHIEVVVGHLDESRTFLFESRFLPKEDRQKIVAMRDAYERTYRDVVQLGIDEGSMHEDLDPGVTAIFILSTMNALVRWYRPEGARRAEEIAADMWTFVSRGIAKEAPQ